MMPIKRKGEWSGGRNRQKKLWDWNLLLLITFVSKYLWFLISYLFSFPLSILCISIYRCTELDDGNKVRGEWKSKYEGKDKFNKKMDFMSIKDEILKITSYLNLFY